VAIAICSLTWERDLWLGLPILLLALIELLLRAVIEAVT
jgi:hypothetical protein